MAVSWRSLELEGFGRYRDRVRVQFTGGLNTLVADNEAGKSTLVAGLTAVLFGLPRAASGDEFFAARFQNWDRPERFAGGVEFDAAGEQYRLRRDFTNNRIRLEVRETSGEWRTTVQGEHNPLAQKRNERYEEAISALLGLSSRDLFWKTFCVTQPLPEAKKLDRSIQRFLSGAGGDLKAALEWLFDRLREITKRNSEFGVRAAADGRKDRQLDEERTRVASLENTIRESEGTLDRLYAESAELAAAEERRRQAQAALQDKEAASSAFTEWQGLRNLYETRVREKMQVEQALEAFQARQEAYDVLAAEIDREYGPFKDAGVGERLGELSNLEARLAERQAQVASAREQVAALEGESRAIGADLRDNYASVRGRQHLVVQVRALQQLSAELADLRRQVDASVAGAQAAQQALETMPAFNTLGDSPVQAISYVKTQALDFQKAWTRATAIAASLERAWARIEREYAAFEKAEPASLDALSRYDTRVDRLEHEVERRQAELDRARQLIEDHTAMEARARQDFSDVWDLNTAFAEAAEKKITLLRESYEILRRGGAEEVAGRPDREWREAEPLPLGRRIAATLLFGIGGFVAAWSLLGSPQSGPAIIVAAAVAVVGAVLGWGIGAAWSGARVPAPESQSYKGVAPGTTGQRRATSMPGYAERLALIQREMAQLDIVLGDHSCADQAVLAALLERIRARDARQRDLETARRSLPQGQALASLSARLDATRKELSEFRNLAKPYTDRFGDIAGALSAWQALRAEERSLSSQFSQALAALGFPSPEAGRGLPEWLDSLHADSIPSMAGVLSLAQLTGARPATARELAAWVAERDEAWWDETATAAARFEDLTHRDGVARRTAADLGERASRLDTEVKNLRQQTMPFDENTDAEQLEAMWNAARAAERQMERVLASLETLRQRLEPSDADRRRLHGLVSSLRSELQASLDAAGGITARAAELWSECQDHLGKASGIEREMEGILRGQQAASAVALRQRATDAQLRALDVLNKWQSLLAGHSELPPTELAFDIEALARLQRQRQQEIQDLRAALARAGDDVERLRDRVAATKAAQVSNVAGLAEELKEHRRLVARLEVDAKSLGIAYNELDAARREYQTRYRDLLSDRATGRFRELSGVFSRRVVFGEDFEVGVTEDGRTVTLEQLSQGARDQLYLSIRLALADLLARDVELPFIFDDPFLTCDEPRTERIREALLTIAASRQVIVLSHRNEIASWGHNAEIHSTV